MSINMRIIKILFFPALMGFSNLAFSCGCSESSISSDYERADIVFSGLVTSGVLVSSLDKNEVIQYDVSTIEKFKGDVESSEKLTVQHGHSCGMALYVGYEYMFFIEDDRVLWMCSGSDRLKRYEVTDEIDVLKKLRAKEIF